MKTFNFVIFYLMALLLSINLSIWGLEKKAILILGMHRSGTSATAGVLRAMGLFLGSNLFPADQTNPKGFFEDSETIKINDWILKQLNSSSGDSRPLKVNWNSPKMENFKNKIKEHLYNTFHDVSLFGLKDPRIVLLIPLYIKACNELSYNPKLIIVRRNSEEIVNSLQKIYPKMTEIKATTLIKKYLDSIELYTKNSEKLIIHFDDLINKTNEVMQQVHEFIPELDNGPEVISKVMHFLDKNLKHHNSI